MFKILSLELRKYLLVDDLNHYHLIIQNRHPDSSILDYFKKGGLENVVYKKVESKHILPYLDNHLEDDCLGYIQDKIEFPDNENFVYYVAHTDSSQVNRKEEDSNESKRKRGRKSKVTEELEEEILNLLKTKSVKEVAELVNLSLPTIYKVRNNA